MYQMISDKLKTRKDFLRELSLITGATLLPAGLFASARKSGELKARLGLVTYLWAKDWDIPTLIKNCSATGMLGVELREQHAHGVGTDLSVEKRKEVRKRFADSPVTLVGLGTNQQYDYPDQNQLKDSIARTKDWIKLSVDIGASGVKVKPNQFHEDVAKEKTIEQIGKALHSLGKYAIDQGQLIRLEVHGPETSLLPNIKAMMDFVENPGVKVCWNSNPADLEGEGLKYNFNLVKDRIGDTAHIRELTDTKYPFQELMNLFAGINYKGWMLLECSSDPSDKIAALAEQRQLWEKMVAQANRT